VLAGAAAGIFATRSTFSVGAAKSFLFPNFFSGNGLRRGFELASTSPPLAKSLQNCLPHSSESRDRCEIVAFRGVEGGNGADSTIIINYCQHLRIFEHTSFT
jgi:hypothetical protein